MLRLVSDEDVPGTIVSELRRRQPGLDVVRVQEVNLRRTPDPEVLAWAAHQGRQVFTRDSNTMTAHAYDRVVRGLPMLGLFVISQRMSIGQAVSELEVVALASEPHEWHDQVIFLPL